MNLASTGMIFQAAFGLKDQSDEIHPVASLGDLKPSGLKWCFSKLTTSQLENPVFGGQVPQCLGILIWSMDVNGICDVTPHEIACGSKDLQLLRRSLIPLAPGCPLAVAKCIAMFSTQSNVAINNEHQVGSDDDGDDDDDDDDDNTCTADDDGCRHRDSHGMSWSWCYDNDRLS